MANKPLNRQEDPAAPEAIDHTTFAPLPLTTSSAPKLTETATSKEIGRAVELTHKAALYDVDLKYRRRMFELESDHECNMWDMNRYGRTVIDHKAQATADVGGQVDFGILSFMKGTWARSGDALKNMEASGGEIDRPAPDKAESSASKGEEESRPS